jgi:exosortase
MAVALVALAACYGSILGGMAERWMVDEDMSHGFIVPAVVAWVLWRERDRWLDLPVRPSWAGFALLTAGAVMHVLACSGGGLSLGSAVLMVSLAGAILALGGVAWLRAWAFPLLLTLFMLPKLVIVYDRVTLPLQLLSTRIAEAMLRLAGIAAARDGNILTAGGHRILVAEACSGLRYLLPLAFLALIYAYASGGGTRVRTALVVAALPVAILANSVRVAASAWIPALAEGALHTFAGSAIFLACLPVLGLLRHGLNSIEAARRA